MVNVPTTGGGPILVVPCDACGAAQRRHVEWLRENHVLTCDDCGHAIDIARNPLRGEIQRAWNAAHDLGPLRRRLP